MSTIERSQHRYRFTCRCCGHEWERDYEVCQATIPDGTVWTVYYRGGASIENPAADLIVCPGCHHTTVTAHLASHHDLPDAV